MKSYIICEWRLLLVSEWVVLGRASVLLPASPQLSPADTQPVSTCQTRTWDHGGSGLPQLLPCHRTSGQFPAGGPCETRHCRKYCSLLIANAGIQTRKRIRGCLSTHRLCAYFHSSPCLALALDSSS